MSNKQELRQNAQLAMVPTICADVHSVNSSMTDIETSYT